MLKDSSYFISLLTTPFVTIIVSIVTMRYVEPELIGYFQTSQLMILYLSFLHFGVFSGLARQYPVAIGTDSEEQAENLLASVRLFASMIAVISVIIVIGVAVVLYLKGANQLLLLTIFLTTVVSFLTIKITFYDVVFRVRQLFKGYGNIILLQNFINLITTVLPILYGYVGLLIKMVVYAVLSFLLRIRKIRLPPASEADIPELKSLAKIGFPILASTYLYQLFFSIDRTFLALFVDMKSLGNYAISAYISGVFIAIIGGVSAYYSPRAISESTKSIRVNYTYIFKCAALSSALIVPGVIFGYIFIGPFIRFFIPEYHAAIEAAKISLLSGISYILLSSSFIFIVLGKIGTYIRLLLAMTALYALITYIMILFLDIKSIESFAWVKLVLTSLFSSLMMIFALIYIHRYQNEAIN